MKSHLIKDSDRLNFEKANHYKYKSEQWNGFLNIERKHWRNIIGDKRLPFIMIKG